jgi:hypothetical protein
MPMAISTSQLGDMAKRIRGFVDESDWEQFNTPKNLAMPLSGQVGELTEIFQW